MEESEEAVEIITTKMGSDKDLLLNNLVDLNFITDCIIAKEVTN